MPPGISSRGLRFCPTWNADGICAARHRAAGRVPAAGQPGHHRAADTPAAALARRAARLSRLLILLIELGEQNVYEFVYFKF